jgi:CheY-like chemotaxis protein
MEQPNHFSANILVAEDDPDDRLLVKRALEDSGFAGNLHFVDDGLELMKYLDCSKCRENAEAGPRPDLILLDLNLPVKNGREVLLDIKADPNLHDIKIVALSGSDPAKNAETCSNLGAECLMSKPGTYTTWVEMMGSVLDLLTESGPRKRFYHKI